MHSGGLGQLFRRKVLLGLCASVVLTVIAAIAAAIAISNLLTTNRLSRDIRDRQMAVDAVYLAVREAESGQRGYLITHDTNYLKRYEANVDQLPAMLTQLKSRTAEAPEANSVAQYIPLVQSKLAELKQTVDLGKAGQFDQALQLVATGDGETLMQQILRIRDSIGERDSNALNAKRTAANVLGLYAFDIVLLTTVLTIILAFSIYHFYVKSQAAQLELDRAKDEFVSLASHQLRTPATGIKSVLSMLQAEDFGSLTERQHYFLDKALQSNEREIGIIEELLNVAKADAGRLILRPADMNLNELIDTIASEQGPAITVKRQRLSVKQPHEAVTIYADQEKLYMAIGNLLDNARKYTPEDGEINITVRGRKGGVAVEVTDSGVGIDEEEQARIFDRYQRARSAMLGPTEGTGLGLYLARRIAELHNGTIEVDSRKGHGARFVLVLPMRRT